MTGLQPIYTADNVRIAYQFNWSLSVFWHDAPFSDDWLPALQQVTEADGVRIIEHRFVTPTWQPVPHQHAPRVLAARDSSVGERPLAIPRPRPLAEGISTQRRLARE